MNDGFADHPLRPDSGILTNGASSRARTERAARAEPSLLGLCRVVREEDEVNLYDLLITSELHYHCAIEAFCSRYEVRTRASRLKICYSNQLDQPTILGGEFDRFRTCVNKCHKLAPNHSATNSILLLQMDLNHLLQIQNLPC